MKFSNLTIIVLSLVLFSACQSKKELSAQDSNKSYFIVGEGGGFAGTYVQYQVQQDGVISKYDFKENKYIELKKLKAADVDHFFNEIEESKLGNIDMNSPGNMSQYLIINYMKKSEHKITWPMNSDSVKSKLQEFFDEAFDFCEALNE